MLDDEDLEADAPDDADLPAEGAIPVAGEGWPASAGGADIAPPPYFSAPPGANAEQRRMFDMLNARGMQMYRQALQDRRSQSNQRAIVERQEANQRAAAERQAANQRAIVERQEASRRFEAQKAEYEAKKRHELEQMRIRAERRKDPNFVREEELAQIEGAERAGILASRRRLLDQVQDQRPDARYAGALPLGLQGQGGFRNPTTAMQMPAQAMGAGDINTEEALDLTRGREFAAGPGAARVREDATNKSYKNIDLIKRAARDERLNATARSVETSKGFIADPDERIARFLKPGVNENGSPSTSVIDRVINEGIEEAKSKRVDTALIPEVPVARKRRMAELMADLTEKNNKTSEEIARGVYNMVYNMAPDERPEVMMTNNGALVQVGDMRLVFNEDQWRKLMVLRGARQKEYDAAKATIRDRKTKQDEAEAARVVQGRQDVDDRDRFVDSLKLSPNQAEALAAVREIPNRAIELDRRRRQLMGLE